MAAVISSHSILKWTSLTGTSQKQLIFSEMIKGFTTWSLWLEATTMSWSQFQGSWSRLTSGRLNLCVCVVRTNLGFFGFSQSPDSLTLASPRTISSWWSKFCTSLLQSWCLSARKPLVLTSLLPNCGRKWPQLFADTKWPIFASRVRSSFWMMSTTNRSQSEHRAICYGTFKLWARNLFDDSELMKKAENSRIVYSTQYWTPTPCGTQNIWSYLSVKDLSPQNTSIVVKLRNGGKWRTKIKVVMPSSFVFVSYFFWQMVKLSQVESDRFAPHTHTHTHARRLAGRMGRFCSPVSSLLSPQISP